jgi:hypothetical protein
MTQQLESLESRRLCSAAAVDALPSTVPEPARPELAMPLGAGKVRVRLRHGELLVRGDGNDNSITLAAGPNGRGVSIISNGGGRILDTGAGPRRSIGTRVNGKFRPLKIRRAVSSIRAELGRGADWIAVAGSGDTPLSLPALRVDGGDGADVVILRSINLGSIEVAPSAGDLTHAGDTVIFRDAHATGAATLSGGADADHVELWSSLFDAPLTIDTGPGRDSLITSADPGSLDRSIFAAGMILTDSTGDDQIVTYVDPALPRPL